MARGGVDPDAPGQSKSPCKLASTLDRPGLPFGPSPQSRRLALDSGADGDTENRRLGPCAESRVVPAAVCGFSPLLRECRLRAAGFIEPSLRLPDRIPVPGGSA